ncbi:hypothetical protein SANTM175S_09449 [Streptomyces antimycoticus]
MPVEEGPAGPAGARVDRDGAAAVVGGAVRNGRQRREPPLGAVEDVGGGADLDAYHQGELAGVAGGPADDGVEGVQPGVTAHADDIQTLAGLFDTQVLDEERGESGGEQSGGGDAAQVPDVAERGACVLQAVFDGVPAYPQSARGVFAQQLALGLDGGQSVGAGRGQGEVAAFDGTAEEDGADPPIGDTEGVEDFLLRVGSRRHGGSDADDTRGTGARPLRRVFWS